MDELFFNPSDPFNYAHEDAVFLYAGKLAEDSEPEELLNDVGHASGCDCPVCLPELYDPAELEAGRPSRERAA